MLKWWRVREGNCPDTTFVKELFTKIQEIYSEWVADVKRDYRYRQKIKKLRLKEPTEKRFLYYFKDPISPQLKECIKKGDGTELSLSRWSMVNTDNMVTCLYRS